MSLLLDFVSYFIPLLEIEKLRVERLNDPAKDFKVKMYIFRTILKIADYYLLIKEQI